jgi:hypothetical protein
MFKESPRERTILLLYFLNTKRLEPQAGQVSAALHTLFTRFLEIIPLCVSVRLRTDSVAPIEQNLREHHPCFRYAYASDHKTAIFPRFFHLSSDCAFHSPKKSTKNGPQPTIKDDVILHEMHSFFVQILIHAYSIPSRLFIRFDTLLDTF